MLSIDLRTGMIVLLFRFVGMRIMSIFLFSVVHGMRHQQCYIRLMNSSDQINLIRMQSKRIMYDGRSP